MPPERQVKLMKGMTTILLAGLLVSFCLAGIAAAQGELPVCNTGDTVGPGVTSTGISAQTAKPTDVITLTATVDDSGSGGSHVMGTFSIGGPADECIEPYDCGDWPVMDPVSPVPAATLDFIKTIDLSQYDLTPGIYTVCINGKDACNYVSSDGIACYTLVIYDPDGGFVTGGGWIDSPAGAYAAGPTLAGRANFGFVSKYLKGATVPTGQTQFQFKVGDLNFHSSSYDWLVVAGAKAQYKGTGTINHAGNYRFMLTAVDGQLPGGGGTDRFRIRIWEMVNDEYGNEIESPVYDNQLGDMDSADPATAIAGGSIVIHKT